MKIAEIEEKIEHGDCSEEILEMFRLALKRVPKNSRCQHCYATAASMPSRFHEEAISLIQHGLTCHCDSWFDRMRSYHNIAIILEENENYVGAKEAYREAFDSIEVDKQSGYDSEYAAHMMRMEMHISNFEYTDDLQKYYHIAIRGDEFSQEFLKKKFYRLLAEIIIFSKNNDWENAKKAFSEANDMLHPNFTGSLTALLKRKGFIESVGATKHALAFMRKVKRAF